MKLKNIVITCAKIENIIIACILIAMAIFAGYTLFSPKTASQDTTHLIMGTVTGYAPWVSTNPEGELEGFDIDVANALAKQMGKQLTLKDLGSMTSLFTALDQGKIDAIIWGMSITQNRLKKVAMIQYQGEITTSYPLLFWNKIPADIKSIDDMHGKTVCVEPASAQEAALRPYDFINQLPTEKIDDALLNIQYGKADAAFVEPAIAKKFKNKYPEIQILDVPLNPENQVHGVGIVLRKNDTLRIAQIESAVAALKTAGIIKQLEQKWDMMP